jgi:putative transposase
VNYEEWRWGSLFRRTQGTPEERALLADSPVPLGRDWVKYGYQPQTKGEVEAIRRSVKRGQPSGSGTWQQMVAERMGLEHNFRPRGRPRKSEESA